MNVLIAALENLVVLLKKKHQANNMPMTYPKIKAWADAIAKFEGADASLNNPGDLKLSTLTASWGGTRGFQAADGGWIAKFATEEQGMTALYDFLVLGAEDELLAFHGSRTLYEFMRVYAGNPSQQYIQGIAGELKVPPATDVSTFLT